VRGRSRRRRLTRQTSIGWLAALLVLALAGCSGSSSVPKPSVSSLTPTPTPSASNEPKPGGTLRIAGVTRTVVLDPASPISDPAATDGVGAATSAATANRMLGRLVLRQLYGYEAVDPTDVDGQNDKQDQTTGPQPDLATGAPKLTDSGLTATITLRSARWDVPSTRRVTATDELRALKRLCLPAVASPVSGYLAESVVGYAAACQAIASKPPATLAALDAIAVTGLTTEGDTTLVIHLLRPTNDLTAILSLPQTSPLPVESFTGMRVTDAAQSFVGDGPYRFIDPQDGETYALSRSPSWDPAADPLRHAYVDHISVRGGLTAAEVQQRIAAGSADLSLDAPVSATAAAGSAADAVVRTAGQSSVVLAVGSKGASARRLALPAVRSVLASCIDSATRTKIAAALGSGGAKASADLFSGFSLVPAGQPSPSPSSSSSPGVSRSAAPTSTGGSVAPASGAAIPSSSPSASAGASVGAEASVSPATRCVRISGVSGSTFSLLIADSKPLRAAAAVIKARVLAAGIHLTVKVADPKHFDGYARSGGWDLLLSVRQVRYPAPRTLLAPLLDARWRGGDAVALLRSSTFVAVMEAAVAGRDSDTTIELWNRLQARLTETASLLPLAVVDGVYPRGANVAHAPTVPTFMNADPANVALGSTRPGDPARTATPAS
jgi:ABC-type transport system substrate-binding protein